MNLAALRRASIAAILFAAVLPSPAQQAPLITQAPAHKWAIVMHGGAGVIERSSMTPERDKAYRAGLDEAIRAAAAVLDKNGSSDDAVVAALQKLEDNPLFNCGKGAVFTAEGRNELDAAIMDGKTLKAGAVAGVTHTRSPISLAQAVMDKSPHVMLVGEGAEQFAASVGLEQVDPSLLLHRATLAEPRPPVQKRRPPYPAASRRRATRTREAHRRTRNPRRPQVGHHRHRRPRPRTAISPPAPPPEARKPSASAG